MNCSRCGDSGAERSEIVYSSGARVVSYLCADCSTTVSSSDVTVELVVED